MIDPIRPWRARGQTTVHKPYREFRVDTEHPKFLALSEDARMYQLWRYGGWDQWRDATEWWRARGVDPG